jgi:transposase InsO family protein
MKSRLIAGVTGDLKGVNVRALCRELDISPKTFYKWRKRFAEKGLDGLEELSRRPLRSPLATSVAMEDEIVRLRKELDGLGVDAGAATIRWHLERSAESVPSVATIWRILVRRGFVVPEPKKRPKASYRRFEAPAPNEMWQMDFTHWELAGGAVVEIYNVIDDHSRLLVRSAVVKVANTQNAWETFCEGVDQWGLPVRCLTDNGLQFSGRLHGFEVDFEIKLRERGVHKINSAPYHPQTCGKVERFHQTLKKWLRARPNARSMRKLQVQLDEFAHYYNEQRPHRALKGQTPLQRFGANTAATGSGHPLLEPARRTTALVSSGGAVTSRPYDIGVGKQHAGKTATVIIDNGYATVLINNDLIRCLRLDPTCRYQPTGIPGGRRPS